MKLSLSEALPLKSIIQKYVQQLRTEREEVAVIQLDENKEPLVKPERTVEEITVELYEAQADYELIIHLIAQANQEKVIEWDGLKVTVLQAIEKAEFMRNEAGLFKRMGARKSIYTENGWRATEKTLFSTNYEPKEYRDKAIKLERQAQRLSTLAQKANSIIEIEFPQAEKYM